MTFVEFYHAFYKGAKGDRFAVSDYHLELLDKIIKENKQLVISPSNTLLRRSYSVLETAFALHQGKTVCIAGKNRGYQAILANLELFDIKFRIVGKTRDTITIEKRDD